MGYYTRHNLTWDDEFRTDEIIEAINNNKDTLYALGRNNRGGEGCKWHDHEKDMRAFSRKFPDVLFTLKGEGEEAGDIWTAYYRNGKSQVEKAIIQIAPFDADKLT